MSPSEVVLLLAAIVLTALLVADWLRRYQQKQAVAVCYRLVQNAPGKVEFLLVRTSNGKRWVFPKGRIARGESAAEAAAREAREEAGIEGCVAGRLPKAANADATFAPYLLEVDTNAKLSKAERESEWFTLSAAEEALRKGRTKKEAKPWLRILSVAALRLNAK